MYVGGNRRWVPLCFCNSGIKRTCHFDDLAQGCSPFPVRLYRACYDLNDGLFGFWNPTITLLGHFLSLPLWSSSNTPSILTVSCHYALHHLPPVFLDIYIHHLPQILWWLGHPVKQYLHMRTLFPRFIIITAHFSEFRIPYQCLCWKYRQHLLKCLLVSHSFYIILNHP